MDMTLAIALIAFALSVGYLIGRSRARPDALPPVAPPDAAALDAVRTILANDGQIAAIKAYRLRTGTGLRDAKLAVDTLITRAP